MLNGVAVGVEEGGVPVAEGLVAFGGMEGEAEVAPRDVESGVSSTHHDHGSLGVGAVVAGSGFGHVDDGGVVKHATLSFGDGLEFGDHLFDLGHVALLDDVAQIEIHAVTEPVEVDASGVSREAVDWSSEVINGVSDDVCEAGDESR